MTTLLPKEKDASRNLEDGIHPVKSVPYTSMVRHLKWNIYSVWNLYIKIHGTSTERNSWNYACTSITLNTEVWLCHKNMVKKLISQMESHVEKATPTDLCMPFQ